MVDTTKIADEIDGLTDKKVKVGGFKLTFGSIMAILAFLSTITGTLYGGFLMWQKVEAVAGLDLDEYQAEIRFIDNKITALTEKSEQGIDYTRDIKNNLRNDILRLEKQSDRTEQLVRNVLDDARDMIDKASRRFETQREQLRSTQKGDMAELEARLEKLVQRALDNPLAN
jgi:hypothetical protein